MTKGDPRPLGPGRQFGFHTIHSLLGAGGMGEVSRVRDTKLGRDVALKVLPPSFAGDPDRLSRFEREALLLASLNHPNIATIHGVEDSGDIRALVMELVEGWTLAERLERSKDRSLHDSSDRGVHDESGRGRSSDRPGIAIAEVLAIARQIADGLQAAHDHGVIHRDLKPANIKVRPDGTVKVLDFGLAKILDAQPAGGALSNSPTMMASMPGMLLGTAAYMSPEQAKGQEADRRSDVWAFGCVLFEMLTGHKVFEGGTSSEVLAGVLKSEPDWQRLPAGTPEAIRRLLRRCLQKDEKRRLRDLGDVRLEIDEARSELLSPRPATKLTDRRTERRVWGAAVEFLALLAVAIGVWAVRPAPALPVVQFDIHTPPASGGLDLASMGVALDARKLVFVANSDGQAHWWVRPLDSVVARPLPGTAGAQFPFWSPDSRSVAFFADGVLKRLDLDGGLVRTLTKAIDGVGGAWNRDGVILFVPNLASPVWRVPADGGPPIEVLRLETGQAGHGSPRFLPDGSHFLYFVTADPGGRGIYVGQLEGSPPRKLFDADAGAVYTNDHLLFVRQTMVFAQAFDAQRLELKGSPFQVADGVLMGNFGLSALSAAATGSIAFRAGTARFGRQFIWVG